MTELERTASALFHLDPGCSREDWIRAAMGAKDAGLPFETFHEWSKPAANFRSESDCRAVWKSIKPGEVTKATLFAMAYERGWKDPTKRLQAENGGRGTDAIAAPRKTLVSPVKQGANVNPDEVWACCVQATSEHEYIRRKQGLAGGLRVYPHDAPPLVIRRQNVAGYLVIPCFDLNGMLQTLQFIPGKGDKLNLPGASFGIGCFIVGDLAASGRVFVVEGIGQAWAVWKATGCAAVVSFGAGRMGAVAVALHDKYTSVPLVLLPDRGKEGQAEAIARAVNGAWCEMPGDMPSNFDANDFMQEHGADALAERLECVKTPPMRFNLLHGMDLCNAPPMRWMVRGVLPVEGLASIYGPSGAGKSFLTLSLAASVAGGDYAWFGRRVAQCPVTYICLEGEQGMGKRVKAWYLHHDKPLPDALRFVMQSFDLLANDDVTELAQAVRAASGAGGLVILDTLNRATPGADENTSVDMGKIIAASKRLQDAVGGLVLVTHHVGKDASRGMRGHSSLIAALDGAIEVTKTEKRREWNVAKSKDDEAGCVHAFRLHTVTVGVDEDGEDIASCVALPDDFGEGVKRTKLPQGGNQLHAFNALTETFKTSRSFNKPGAIPGRPCVELEAAVIAIAERLPCEPKRRNERARQALSGLIGRGIYALSEGWLWRCD